MSLVPAVLELLDVVTSELHLVLGPNLLGIYLRGSLAVGDFNPETSDVDIVVVLKRRVTSQEFAALKIVHEKIGELSNPYAKRLEGSYIDREAIRNFKKHERRHPTFGSDSQLEWFDHRDNWIIELHTVREFGVIVFGPPPSEIINPITDNDLRQAVVAELRSRTWAYELHSPEWLLPRYYQAFEVETICRALCTLATAKLPSKPQAVIWANNNLPQEWIALVQASQIWRDDLEDDASTVPQVQAFVRWAVERQV